MGFNATRGQLNNRETFFYFMNERHRIYLRRKEGQPWPWTKDEIFQNYRFTNVYRDLDAVSQDVKAQILDKYRPWKKSYAPALVREVVAYRSFNWPATWQRIGPLLDDWDEQRAIRRLMKVAASERKEDRKVFTGAYIIPNGGIPTPKIELACTAISVAIAKAETIVREIRGNRTIQNAVQVFQRYIPLCGPFIAYELVSDLRWSPLLQNAPDIMTWANPGLGAARGLDRVYDRPLRKISNTPPSQLVREMRELLRESQQPGVLGKHMRPLEMRDIEHSLCETDKYLRVRNGEGKPKQGYKPPAAAMRPGRKAA